MTSKTELLTDLANNLLLHVAPEKDPKEVLINLALMLACGNVSKKVDKVVDLEGINEQNIPTAKIAILNFEQNKGRGDNPYTEGSLAYKTWNSVRDLCDKEFQVVKRQLSID